MKKTMLMFFKIISVIFFLFCLGENQKAKSEERNNMRIKITVNNKVFIANMYDNPTARDFISLLPLTLELKDYADTEKIANLPRKLSEKNAPSGSDPSIGDITYYAPWGNLALFYRDFGYANGLIILGNIISSSDFFENCNVSNDIKIENLQSNDK